MPLEEITTPRLAEYAAGKFAVICIATMTPEKNEYGRYLAHVFLLYSVATFIKVLFTLASPLSLFTEEAQYWLWSQNLDWSYYSKPVMIALTNFISTAVLGNTEMGIRVNALIFTFLMGPLIFRFTWELYRNAKTAYYASLILLVLPHFHLNSLFYMTDTPLAFFWLLSMYLVWKALKTNKLKHWLLAGCAVGLGFLSKFLAVLIFPVLVIYLYRYRRHMLTGKNFCLFFLVFLLFTIPVIIWNFKYDFVTFKHVGTLGVAAGVKNEAFVSTALKNIGEYVGGQLGINSPFLVFVVLAALIYYFRKNDERAFFLGLPAILAFTGFFFVAMQKRIEVNWPTFGYLTLPIITAAYITEKKWFKSTAILAGITGFLLLIATFPQLADPLGFEKVLKPKKDPFVRLAGHEEVGDEISRIIRERNLKKYFIFSDSYHFASEAAFYTVGTPQTYCINLGRRMNQFDLWPGIEQFENEGYTGIYVANHQTLDTRVEDAFEKILETKEVEAWHRGEVVARYYIYLLDNFSQMEQEAIRRY